MKIPIQTRARGLIFDLDGTLIDDMQLHLQAWQETGKKHGFHYSAELFYSNAGMSTAAIIDLLNHEFNLSLDQEQILTEKEDRFLSLLEYSRPIQPVLDIARFYHQQLPIAIGTGSKKYMADKVIEEHGLDQYFSIVITADDVKQHKPEPDTFLECARQMGIEPAFCQVFEDGDLGLMAAQKAGMMATDIRPYVYDGKTVKTD